MTRTESLRRWQRIADGDLLTSEADDPDQLHEWVCEVARALIAADQVHKGVRPHTLVDAVGLLGERDRVPAELREALLIHDSFPVHDHAGKPRAFARGERIRRLRLVARAFEGFTDADLSDAEVDRVIRRIVKS